ncbi:MAG: phenylalanine 4-monooxygenase [Gemmatimonadetes bacterium]|nr:phenylalanine 4-monooxygenase [Gemmatimonadota bacterium]
MQHAESKTQEEMFTTQNWSAYTAEQHEVWGILYGRRMEQLGDTASQVFLRGADAIGLNRDQVPDLKDVNQRLGEMTGWQSVPVTGFIPAGEFFRCLAERRFPTTVTLRSREQLEYLEEPDIFHDIFGHVPLHADTVFADLLQRFGKVAAMAESEEEITRMARLFWFTIEFGLVKESGDVKLYGSGLISSIADGANALSDNCDRRPFDLDAVMDQHFEIDHLQDVLFVIESFDQLFEAVEVLGGPR